MVMLSKAITVGSYYEPTVIFTIMPVPKGPGGDRLSLPVLFKPKPAVIEHLQ
jgi:hypothetical protein